MIDTEIDKFLNTVIDGQNIRVVTTSGRTFEGVLNGEETSREAGLYFDSLEGKELRADWENIEAIDFRSSRAVAGRMMVPPEHPLSGTQPSVLRAHTKRNP